MAKVMRIEKLENYRVAWCDDFRGYIIDRKNSVKIGDKIDTEVTLLHAELTEMKKELAEWKKRGKKPIKQFEYKDWILSLFKVKGVREVEWIREEAERLDYSWQMIQRVRREMLDTKIKVKRSKSNKNKWVWYRDTGLVNVGAMK